MVMFSKESGMPFNYVESLSPNKFAMIKAVYGGLNKAIEEVRKSPKAFGYE